MAAPIVNTPGTAPKAKVVSIAREVEAWALTEGVRITLFYGSTTWADHDNLRCLDIMTASAVHADTGKQLSAEESRLFGDKLRAYLKASAKRLGINGIIWWGMVTGFPHAVNPTYRGPYGEARKYTGPKNHHEHVHVEVDGSPYVEPVVTGGGGGDVPTNYPHPADKVVYVSKLRPGQKHSDSVWWVQKALGVHPDGNYSPVLVEAVKVWQRSMKDDVVDGDLGPVGARALFDQHKDLGVRVEDKP